MDNVTFNDYYKRLNLQTPERPIQKSIPLMKNGKFNLEALFILEQGQQAEPIGYTFVLSVCMVSEGSNYCRSDDTGCPSVETALALHA